MAQMLNDRDSTAKHLSTVRRHSRLCRQFNQKEMADAIKSPYEALIAKSAVTLQKVAQKEDCFDDVAMADALLDDEVRNVFAAVEAHDRSNAAAAVMRRVFPDEKFGPIIRTPMMKEPDVVAQLCLRIQALGEDHPLYPKAAELNERVMASKALIAAYDEAVRAVKMAEAEEEIAEAALRRQYETNYYTACGRLGKAVAERIFPVISSKKATVAAGETVEVDGLQMT